MTEGGEVVILLLDDGHQWATEGGEVVILLLCLIDFEHGKEALWRRRG